MSVRGSPLKTADNREEPPPPEGTVERWCWDLIHADELDRKRLPSPEAIFETSPNPRRISRPGRSASLEIVKRSPRTPSSAALRRTEVRAALVHTFLHHEVQAAELFAWAVLAFPETPQRFREGLVRLACEELEHAGLYEEHLA